VHSRSWANFRFILADGVMAGLRGLLLLALALPLGGCFSVTAPKEIPGWAMSSAAEPAEPARRKVARRTPRAVGEETVSERPTVTGNVAMPTNGERPAVRTVTRPSPSPSPSSSMTPFTPEWHARENAADEQLRRRMNICNGC
jgi:hypothetical protein